MALEKIDIETLDPAATIVVATGNAHYAAKSACSKFKALIETVFQFSHVFFCN